MNKTALITGITGQDGSYLAELLLHENYNVVGIVRRASTNNLERIRHIANKITLVEGDITDSLFVKYVIDEYAPDEIYNFAAQSHVHSSFSVPDYTFRVNTLGLLNILEAVRFSEYTSRIYQASSSEMFGCVPSPQGLYSQFEPVSPYGVSKLASHQLAHMYKDVYGMFIVSGILFNHESPRRGENFVTRKITKYFGGGDNLQSLRLGNINAKRDWGFAPDYVSIIHSQMLMDTAEDVVLGTGESHSIRDFLNVLGEYRWMDWSKYVVPNSPEFMRPQDIHHLEADPTVDPSICNFEMLVKIMSDYDNDDLPGEGKEYYMDTYGDTFAWRT